jgi:hypothetical protein
MKAGAPTALGTVVAHPMLVTPGARHSPVLDTARCSTQPGARHSPVLDTARCSTQPGACRTPVLDTPRCLSHTGACRTPLDHLADAGGLRGPHKVCDERDRVRERGGSRRPCRRCHRSAAGSRKATSLDLGPCAPEGGASRPVAAESNAQRPARALSLLVPPIAPRVGLRKPQPAPPSATRWTPCGSNRQLSPLTSISSARAARESDKAARRADRSAQAASNRRRPVRPDGCAPPRALANGQVVLDEGVGPRSSGQESCQTSPRQPCCPADRSSRPGTTARPAAPGPTATSRGVILTILIRMRLDAASGRAEPRRAAPGAHARPARHDHRCDHPLA